MTDRLYFVPFLVRALEAGGTDAFCEALEVIQSMGARPEYRLGYEQFQRWMGEVVEWAELDQEDLHARMTVMAETLTLELATGAFTGSEEDKEKALILIDSQPASCSGKASSNNATFSCPMPLPVRLFASPLIQGIPHTLPRWRSRSWEANAVYVCFREFGQAASKSESLRLGEISMKADPQAIGRAKTVLVFGDDENAVAVVSTITVRPLRRDSGDPIRIVGPVSFEDGTIEHIRRVILPLVQRIIESLGVVLPCFELSVSNLGVASIRDVGLHIIGFSADTPVFLSLLSAALRLAIPQDLVSTGHLASSAGDIRMVRNLAAKVRAAAQTPGIRTFVCPDIDADRSVGILSSQEEHLAREALCEARDSVSVVTVSRLEDLLRVAIPEESVLGAALDNGYFLNGPTHSTRSVRTDSVMEFLAGNLETRFLSCVRNGFLQKASEQACQLVAQRTRLHARTQTYPAGFGMELFRILQSLPPATRSLSIRFPLLPPSEILPLIAHASAQDLPVVRRLLDAVFGDRFSRPERAVESPGSGSSRTDAKRLLESLLQEISPRTLTEKIGLPIDTARASFLLDSTIVRSREESREVVVSFFAQILGHSTVLVGQANREALAREAFDLLDRAFARWGGEKAAQAEAFTGTRGGLRFVLDVLTTQFKREQEDKHVAMVFKEPLGSLEYDEKIQVMAALLAFLGPHLPPELRDLSPEQLAGDSGIIVRGVRKFLDEVNDTLGRY